VRARVREEATVPSWAREEETVPSWAEAEEEIPSWEEAEEAATTYLFSIIFVQKKKRHQYSLFPSQ
jgi:hypothetical protein